MEKQRFQSDLSLLAETFQINRSNDCQVLNDWLSATYEFNNTEKDVFESLVRFTTLMGRDYCVSKNFNGDERQDLLPNNFYSPKTQRHNFKSVIGFDKLFLSLD